MRVPASLPDFDRTLPQVGVPEPVAEELVGPVSLLGVGDRSSAPSIPGSSCPPLWRSRGSPPVSSPSLRSPMTHCAGWPRALRAGDERRSRKQERPSASLSGGESSEWSPSSSTRSRIRMRYLPFSGLPWPNRRGCVTANQVRADQRQERHAHRSAGRGNQTARPFS